MPQSRERHALYISLHRKIQKEHPEWGKEKVNGEVKAQLSVFPKEHKPRRFATNGKYRSSYTHFPELSNWNENVPVTKEELFKFQEGRCAICGKKPKRLDYDHDYSTGLPRGLVCHSCNLLLGRYDNGKYTDSVDAIRPSIERFLANTPVSQVQNLKTKGSQDIVSGSQRGCTGSQKRISQVSGSYENGYWTGVCPRCNHHNKMDPKRSYRPVEKCEHFQQLRIPGKPSEFIFNRPSKESTHESGNPGTEKYLLSYSRNKYQFVLYSVSPAGTRSLVRSCKKNEKLLLGSCEIELTWGPDACHDGNENGADVV